jgi:hypothetical protein
MCEYTDTFNQIAAVNAFSNVFKITVSPIILEDLELDLEPDLELDLEPDLELDLELELDLDIDLINMPP